MRVLSRLFRRLLLLDIFEALSDAGRLAFYGDLAPFADKAAFAAALAPLRRCERVDYAKRRFARPRAVLAYLSRYTHRVAIATSRIVGRDGNSVTFKWKDYRVKTTDRRKTMTLTANEFFHRFLLHVLPSGFHRIRHNCLFANPWRGANFERLRELIVADVAIAPLAHRSAAASNIDAPATRTTCPCCGGRMRVVEVFARAAPARAFSAEPARTDTS